MRNRRIFVEWVSEWRVLIHHRHVPRARGSCGEGEWVLWRADGPVRAQKRKVNMVQEMSCQGKVGYVKR